MEKKKKRKRDEPPQRRVDATEIPEIRLTALEVDELWNLAVGRLVRGQGMQAGRGLAFQERVARQRHSERAHRRIASEDGCVAAQIGSLSRGGGQDPAR